MFNGEVSDGPKGTGMMSTLPRGAVIAKVQDLSELARRTLAAGIALLQPK